MTPTLLDLRGEQVNPFPPKKTSDGKTTATSKVVGGKTVVRAPSTITGIVVHQTACVFGPAADRQKAYRRALGIPAHAVAFRDGVFVAPCDLRWYVYTSNGFNATTLGLEIEGKYRGLQADPKTCWGGNETPLDDLTVETARAALKWLFDEGRALGMPIRVVYAHRQSNGQKPSDPGEGLWKRVVLDYAVPVLGLSTAPSRVLDDGKPIPSAWDPASPAKY